MRKRPWLIVIIVLVLIIGGGWLYLRFQMASTRPVDQYVTEIAVIGQVTSTVSDSGHLEPHQLREVHAVTTGEVAAVHASEGEAVNKDDVLLELDSEDLQFAAERNRLELQSARLNLRELLGIGPDDRLPDDLMGATSVTTPASGRLRSLEVEEGDRISSNARLGEIVPDDHAHLQVGVTPREVKHMSPGDEVTVYLHDFAGSHSGQVVEIDEEASPADRVALHTVEVTIDNPRGLISPGQTGDIHFTAGGMTRKGEVIDPPVTRVYSEVAGTVEQIMVRAGQTVHEDAPFLTLSSPSHSVAVNQQLLRIQQTELSIAQDERALENLFVPSPISGIITRVECEPGDPVSPGTHLFTVADPDPYHLEIEVDELEIASVQVGQEAHIQVDALPRADIRGEVASISSTATIADGVAVYPVTIIVASHDDLREGMSATAEIEVGHVSDVVVVPAEAVVTADGVSTVRVRTEEGVEVREVEVGLSDGSYTEITSGIEAGEEVVLASVRQEWPAHFMGPGGGG